MIIISIKIIKKPSPHKSSRNLWMPDMICCHQTSGSISSAVNWFLNPKSRVSSHFAVSKNGNIYQFVELKYAAWCNGNKYEDKDKKETNHYTKSPNKIIKKRKANANWYTVSIEFENKDTGILAEAQYKAGYELIKHIISEIKSLYGFDFTANREHLIGHNEISPINKASCPGKNFPFERLLKDLASSAIAEEVKEGDTVIFNGTVFLDSYGGTAKGTRTGSGLIKRIIPDRKAAYLVDGIGWFEKTSIIKKLK